MSEMITKKIIASKSRSRRAFIQNLLPLTLTLLNPWTVFAEQVDLYSVDTLNRRKIKREGVGIDIPTLADSGNSIPVKLDFRAPSGTKITSFSMIAPENPNPLLIQVDLAQPASTYRFGTRIRLALTQEIWVIATLDNGAEIAGTATTVVTLNACFDAT